MDGGDGTETYCGGDGGGDVMELYWDVVVVQLLSVGGMFVVVQVVFCFLLVS